MTRKRPIYRSYLLRLWQSYNDDQLVWRASLQSPNSNKRQGFASLESLYEFLKNHTSTSEQLHRQSGAELDTPDTCAERLD